MSAGTVLITGAATGIGALACPVARVVFGVSLWPHPGMSTAMTRWWAAR
jgi:hypothetical protein